MIYRSEHFYVVIPEADAAFVSRRFDQSDKFVSLVVHLLPVSPSKRLTGELKCQLYVSNKLDLLGN